MKDRVYPFNALLRNCIIEDITRDVLRYPSYSLSEARSLIKNRVHHLRQKIKSTDCAQQLIQSVRGSGYCLIDDNLEE
ncbi:MAG: winged helix-turn-helix domain-containing protein [Oscillochloris sp.]|nr:winged helix-turn-helix domain-containing protein [Oscillochloris sp.]